MDKSPSTITLLACPQEIVDVILSELFPCLSSLASVARTCRRLYKAATPILYKSVMIWHIIDSTLFARTIEESPFLIPFVQKLEMHLHDNPWGPEKYCHLSARDLEPTIAKLVKLESLVWQDPCSPASTEPTLFSQTQALPNLRFCVLGHNADYNQRLFFGPDVLALCHPKVECLTLIAFTIDGQLGWNHEQETPTRSTCLESLILLNCDISPFHLAEVLTFPRALKHFTFKGMKLDRDRYFIMERRARALYVEALSTHASSLETLDFDISFMLPEPIDLSCFTALKRLTIGLPQLVGPPKAPSFKSYSPGTLRGRLPRNLEHLTFQDDIGHFHLREVYQIVLSGELPRLSQFTCILRFWSRDYWYTAEIMSRMFNDNCTFKHAFERLGVRLSVIKGDTFLWPKNNQCPYRCWNYERLPMPNRFGLRW